MLTKANVVDGWDERDLVADLRRGEEEAFRRLVSRFGGRMLAVARRMLRSEDEARDVFQEACLNAFRSIGGFREGSSLGTWLHRIVVNAALMRIRSAGRRPEVSIEPLMPTFDETGHHASIVEPWQPDPETALGRREMRRLVRECIDRLPETYRTVLVLRDLEELDTEEAAERLGISENAVKIRLHRARQALATLLGPHLRAEETLVAAHA
jgi:RNA polymerase sigma-70 factor (ECF subfamily)